MIQKNLKKMEREEEITSEELGPPITKSEFGKALKELKLKKKHTE
jgi:hypothetical protein